MNNREKATLIWLGVAFAALMRSREARRSIWAVLDAFLRVKLVTPLLAFVGWILGLVAVAHQVGLWDADLRNDAVVWFFTAGIAFCFSLNKVTDDGFLTQTVRRTVALTVFVEGFVNLEVFGLVVELALLPVLTTLVLMAAVSEGKPEYAPVHRLVSRVLIIVGVCAFVFVAVRLADNFDEEHALRTLVLPVWLTFGSLPFVYLFGLWAAYEGAFMRIDFRTDEPARRRRAKRALFLAANVRASEVGGFTHHWINDLVAAESGREARSVMREWRVSWRAEQRTSRMSTARAFMHALLSSETAVLLEVNADGLRGSWKRLDAEQRAELKAEGLSLASREFVPMVQALPD